MSLPTLADLKAHANITTDVNDTELAEHLDAAVDVVEGIIGPVTSTTVTETHYGLSSGVLLLRRMPVVELTSISSRYGATLTELTLSDYELDVDTGIVRIAAGSAFYGGFSVTYSVGRPTVPAAIRLAILIIAGHLFETQRVPGASRAFGQPETPVMGLGYAIPNRASDLLAPYRMPTVA